MFAEAVGGSVTGESSFHQTQRSCVASSEMFLDLDHKFPFITVLSDIYIKIQPWFMWLWPLP